MVKTKVRISGFIFVAAAVATFVASWIDVFPAVFVERWYARGVFPIISRAAEKIADVIAFSWLDVAVPVGVVVGLVLVYRRRWMWLANVVAGAYLVFFWTWGLNYHRVSLGSKLPVDAEKAKPEGIDALAKRAAGELNRLYGEKGKSSGSDGEAFRRVRRVVEVIDGRVWDAPHRIKISRIGDAWFHAAGVDGMFNPAGQEPLVSNTLLDVERAFVECHELAHVLGYPDEGDANVIAALATIMSKDPAFQYSGWLSLWLYLRSTELDKLLDPGPRQDMKRIFDRAREEQIAWISGLQRVILDWFLKANHVEQGVRSYSRIVLLTAETEPYWEKFR